MEKRISQFISDFFLYQKKYPNEIPSFSQIYEKGELISENFNATESLNSYVNHSEILALQNADKNCKQFEDSLLLTSLEPCIMCTGAIINARIHKVVYFAKTKPNEGISSFSVEMLYSQKFFPELFYCKNEEIEKAFKRFFLAKR